MSTPLETLKQFIFARPEIRRWTVAYSGGLDSTLLLHALVQVIKEEGGSLPVIAIHVHHNLSSNADHWQAHCRQTCLSLGVEFQTENVNLEADGRGLESAAREARYGVFESWLQPDDGLLMAHHLDDQAETLLLRLMRGSGPKGLGAMSEQRPLAAGMLFRPWLAISREQIHAQALSMGLDWIEDESNLSLEFDRNYLRQEVMPRLQQRWPEFARRWQQSAQLCRQSNEVVEQVAAEDFLALDAKAEHFGFSINLDALKQLDLFRRGNVLRYWFDCLGIVVPDAVHLHEIEKQLIDARADATPQVDWGCCSLRRYRHRLYLLDQLLQSVPTDVHWSDGEPISWGQWQLSLLPVAQGGFAFPAEGVTVSVRKGGERCQPLWREHSQSLKKLLQEVGLEPWLRDQIPLLMQDDKIIAVGDLWVCRGWEAQSGQGFALSWQRAG